jgi:hypothetical protein
MTYEEMYHFISSLTTPEVTNLVKKYIDKKEAFFVDVETKEVYELSLDYQAVEIEARKNIMKDLRPNAEREIKERSNTNIKKDPIQGIDELTLIQKSILSIPGERNENSK